MKIIKQVLCPGRLRQTPQQFSWVDQALVRRGYIDRLEARAAALYLFLITVSDAQGLSYYSAATLATRLHLSPEELGTARAQLIDLELIAYQAPLYQVLSLPGTQGAPQTAPVPPTPAPRSENSAGPVRPWRTCSSRCRAAVIDYETFCKIHDHLDRQHLTVAQTARALALSARTVAKWAGVAQFHQRSGVPRKSKLDAYKGQIVGWLDAHPYSGQQIFQRIREAGYQGGITIVNDYVHRIRPRRQEAFLKLEFAPGECAQVDWGEFGTIAVGATRRRLSFFLMVLCHSRRLYLEFTVSQTMEFFLACHENAFAAFGGVPRRIMVDNLKSAVLQRLIGAAPVFNAKYLDFSRHWGFEISPCNVRSGNEKGRVENGVGYVKKNFLAGLELAEFAAMQPAATLWVDTVANVRIHGATQQRPIDRFEQESAHLLPLNAAGFDLARVGTVRATKQFRVPLDSNHYSVPARYAGELLTLKAYAERVCIYAGEQLIARHARSMDRHQDIEDPEHAQQLLAQRKSAREQRLLSQFLALSPRAQAYREGLEAKRVNARVHLRKILALAEIHGKDEVARALDDGLELQAFSAEYIANILGARRRASPEPAALQLTRRADLLELELPEPDLSIYDHDPGDD